MKKRVCILTALSPKRGAGTEKVALEIGKSLSYEFEVIHLFGSKSDEIDKENNITYHGLTIPKISGIGYYLLLIKISNHLRKEKFDIVIDNGGFSFVNLLFYKKKFKLISIIHSGLYNEYQLSYKFMKFIDRVKDFLYHKLVRGPRAYIVKRADKIVVLSESGFRGIQDKYHISSDKIEIIYNGYDKSDIVLKKHDDTLRVCFVSNSHLRKGIDILEIVAKKLLKEKIKFYVIGSDYKSKIKNVEGIGRLERSKLYKFMSNSDVIYLPSNDEGQPLVVLEAMGHGCIPVVSGVCNMDMLKETEFERYISYDNKITDYLDIYIHLLSLNNDKLMDLRNKSQKLVEQYTWNNQGKKYLELVKSIL